MSAQPPPPTRICVFCSTTSGTSPAHLEAARSLAKILSENRIHLVYGGGTTGIMGEVARMMVKLSGVESVLGVIPGAYLSIERPEGGDGGGDAGEPRRVGVGSARASEGRDPWLSRLTGGLMGKGKSTCKRKGVDVSNEAGLLSEEIYGRVKIIADVQIRKKVMAREIATGGPGSGFIALSGGFGTMDELMEMVTWNQLGVHSKGVCVFNVEGFWDTIMEGMERAVEAGFVREGSRELLVERGTAEGCVRWLGDFDGGERLREHDGRKDKV